MSKSACHILLAADMAGIGVCLVTGVYILLVRARFTKLSILRLNSGVSAFFATKI